MADAARVSIRLCELGRASREIRNGLNSQLLEPVGGIDGTVPVATARREPDNSLVPLTARCAARASLDRRPVAHPEPDEPGPRRRRPLPMRAGGEATTPFRYRSEMATCSPTLRSTSDDVTAQNSRMPPVDEPRPTPETDHHR
jgi:hypothetical protein